MSDHVVIPVERDSLADALWELFHQGIEIGVQDIVTTQETICK